MRLGTVTLPEWRRLIVMSDIHANAVAFERAIALARKCGFDQLVLLGDLLTYGGEPLKTLDLVRLLIDGDGAVLVCGNHDELYEGRTRGAYEERLPDWLRETIDWTRGQLYNTNLIDAFPWRDSAVSEEIFFAHANPFAYADWTYLNTPAEIAAAAQALAKRRKRVGVFGHTHRAAFSLIRPNEDLVVRPATDGAAFSALPLAQGEMAIINAGSIGQPRDAAKKSFMLLLDRSERGLQCEFMAIDYDVGAAVKAIDATPLSVTTKDRLRGYLI